MTVEQISIYGVLAVAFIVSAITDALKHKILNIVTFPAIAIGLGLNFAFGSWSGLINSLLGLFLGLLFPLVGLLIVPGGLGMGDVKLMGAVGALLGYKSLKTGDPIILWAFFYTALVGGALALVIIIWKGAFVSTWKKIFKLFVSVAVPNLQIERPDVKDSIKIRYGFAIIIGTVWAIVMRQPI